jgi:hypothetical protein
MTWFDAVRDDEIVISPDDIQSEAFGSLRYLAIA